MNFEKINFDNMETRVTPKNIQRPLFLVEYWLSHHALDALLSAVVQKMIINYRPSLFSKIIKNEKSKRGKSLYKKDEIWKNDDKKAKYRIKKGKNSHIFPLCIT